MMGVALVTLICLFLFVGATGKSAQIPLYVWLPDAMAGPTPVSALIHAATMVTAGVYMMARLNFLFALSPAAMTVVALVGAVTALYAATIGLFQYDIKKVLAYSTVSQLGYMFIGVGVGAYWAGVYHLLTHAVFKALLFLGSGSVILGCHHEQDMRKMGGLKKYMPITRWTYWAGCVAITTAPFFFLSNGFFSKDEILWKAFDAQHLLVPGWVIWLIGFVGAGLTSFYMWRSYYMTFTGDYRGHAEKDDHGHGGTPHESPLSMTGVLATLAVLILPTAYALGFWPLVGVEPLFEHWLHPVTGAATESLAWRSATEHVHSLEVILAVCSIALALSMFGVATWLYRDGKNPLPQKLLDSDSGLLRGIYTVIYNKYFVDEAYDWLVVRRTRQLSELLYSLDQRVIDGAVNLAGFIGRIVAAIDGMIDALVVDGAVNGVAHGLGAAGRAIRRTQTGRIQTYLAGAAVGVLLLILIARLLLA
jgi:NADH-quinone oxidoreductase subunit L